MGQDQQESTNVGNLIKEIDRMKEILEKDQSHGDGDRKRLLLSARALISALQSSEDEAWKFMTGATSAAAFKAIARMGVFDHFTKKTMSAVELAAQTGGDAALIVRLMRPLIANHIFTEVGEESYAHTALSRKLGDKTFLALYGAVELNDMWTAHLADFLESTAFRNPLDPANTLIQYANKSKLPPWDIFMSNPAWLPKLSSSMSAISTIWQHSTTAAISALFPSDKPLPNDEVLVVDVGASKGTVLKDVAKARPDLKERLIFQDLQEVVRGNDGDYGETGVKGMEYDFFTPQPVQGANTYIFRHVLHDWPDVSARQILLNTVSAMSPLSRLVILEQVLPSTGSSLANAHFDVSMMVVSGQERSEAQWRTLLRSCGLRVVRMELCPPESGQETVLDWVIEAVKGDEAALGNGGKADGDV